MSTWYKNKVYQAKNKNFQAKRYTEKYKAVHENIFNFKIYFFLPLVN